MDINREIRVAVNTGETVFGVKEAKKRKESEEAKLFIVSRNCPEQKFEGDEHRGTDIYHYDGTNHELGSAAGKPFSISVITILEEGESNILSVRKD